MRLSRRASDDDFYTWSFDGKAESYRGGYAVDLPTPNGTAARLAEAQARLITLQVGVRFSVSAAGTHGRLLQGDVWLDAKSRVLLVEIVFVNPEERSFAATTYVSRAAQRSLHL